MAEKDVTLQSYRRTAEVPRQNVEVLRVLNKLMYIREDEVAYPNRIIRGNLSVKNGYLYLTGLIDLPYGLDGEGHKVFKTIEKDQILEYGITLQKGINYIYVTEDGMVHVTQDSPKFGGSKPTDSEKGDWFDTDLNVWFDRDGNKIATRNYLGYYVLGTDSGQIAEVVAWDGKATSSTAINAVLTMLGEIKNLVAELDDLKAKIDELGENMTLNERVQSLEIKYGELLCKVDAIVTDELNKNDIVTWDGTKFVPIEVREAIPTLVNGSSSVPNTGDQDNRLEFHIFGKYMASARGAIEVQSDNFTKSAWGNHYYSVVARLTNQDDRPPQGSMYKAYIGDLTAKNGDLIRNVSLSIYDNGDIKVWLTDDTNTINTKNTTFRLYLDGMTFAVA